MNLVNAYKTVNSQVLELTDNITVISIDGRYVLRHYQLDMPIDSQKEFIRQANEFTISPADIRDNIDLAQKFASVIKGAMKAIKLFNIK